MGAALPRPARNAILPLPISFMERDYRSIMEFIREVHPRPRVGKVTLVGRLHSGHKRHGGYDDEWLKDAIMLEPAAYRKKHGTRKTWIEIDGRRQDLAEVYAGIESPVAAYPRFRSRLRGRAGVTMNTALDAAMMGNSEWITHHGGGRRKGFIYTGDLYPDAHGDYTSVTSFLKKIGRYEDKHAIHARLKRNWDLDEALARPPIERDGCYSLVYALTQFSTGRRYIGISVRGIRTRWAEHVKAAYVQNQKTALYQAMRETGQDDFRIEVLEEGTMSSHELAERERHWIESLNTRVPSIGLNSAKGGSIGQVEGFRVTLGGQEYPSRIAAARAVAERCGLPEHVVHSRLKDGKPIPERARRHSTHPEAGSILFRKWKSLARRSEKGLTGEVDPSWIESYDRWKADTQATGKEALNLIRPDVTRPWGPGNHAWGDHIDRVASVHGKSFSAFGVQYRTQSEALRKFGIRKGTFDFRLQSGMTVEEALSAPLGKTSRQGKPFLWEGEEFKSRTQACRDLAARHGITVHQAKDRIVRSISTDRWASMIRS